MAELIFQLLPRLRAERDLGVPELARMTVRMGIHEVPQKSIEALESPQRAGQVPKAATLIALAAALGVAPERFYEWPIAEAQAGRSSRRTPLQIAEDAAQRRRGRQRPSPRHQDEPGESGRGA